MLTGLSAFPITPVDEHDVDERAYARLIDRLAAAKVDSITALGSTGSYPYFTVEQRARVARVAMEHAAGTPVLVGIGALRTNQVLALAEDAQRIGAAGVLLAPVSYQALTPEEVLGLYEDVTAELSVPLVVYDNPGTTHFHFTDDLYAAISALPHVASIKIPGVPADPAGAQQRITHLREMLPAHITIGVSGDSSAATGLIAGCDSWYSVLAGTLPVPSLALTRAAQAGDADRAQAESARLQPIWDLFARYGSLRTVAAIAAHLGLTSEPNLPRPLRALPEAGRRDVAEILASLDLR